MTRVSALVVVALGVAHAWAQTPRDTRRVPTVFMASVSGTVVANDATSAAVRRAILTLARAGGESRTTATDERGRFLFTHLPAGVYTLQATKGGFVPIAYGAARVGLPGNPIPLVDGQHFAATPIGLTRGGVITGRLTSKGVALRRATVEAVQFQVVDGVRRRRTFTGASARGLTDSRGVYRIHSLPPGDYLVNVTSPTMFAGIEIQELTAGEVEWARQQAARGAAAGRLPPATSERASIASELPMGRSFTFAPTFFPGTTDPAAATVVSLRAGEERGGVDFPVLDVPTAELTGVVIGADGRPLAGAGVARVSRTPNHLLSMFGPDRLVPADSDGRFVRSNVPPGEYMLLVRPRGREPLIGLLDVTVHGEDIRDLRIQMRPALSVSGRVVFDGAASPPPRELHGIRPTLLAPSGSPPLIRPDSGVVAADATFRIDQVVPGRYLMTASAAGIGAGWFLESITVNGRNVLDVPFEVSDGQSVTGAVITFSDRATELSGTLTDAQGRPTPQFFVLVYPVERAYWRSASRWIKSARAGVDGSYSIAGLPEGEYYLCALTEVDPDQQYDPAYLDQFIPGSIRITLADGQRLIQHLRIGGF